MRNSTFRYDINGLRAWAVVAVVLYHFGLIGFTGGFIGVDVFFVISGALMTRMIVNGIEKSTNNETKNNFSVLNFYLSRARRIMPALFALCGFTLVVGWFAFSNIEYKSLSTDIISALGFLSNINFLRSAGYFDTASHEKLLLHTWSLAVEWQFYLVLPLALLVMWKLRPGRTPLTIMMVLGLLLSLFLSIIATPLNPNAAFYLLPTRAWEMLAGGLVYLLENSYALSVRRQRLLEGSGLTLIIVSIGLFNTNDLWPSWRAMVPVLGTVMVLVAARQNSLWTSNRIAQWLGDCSYSLYLWHWPFAVALVYLKQQDDAAAITVCLVLTLVCGWLSYRLVETPARTELAGMSPLRGAGALLVALTVLTLPSLLIRWNEGVSGRFPEQTQAIFDEAQNKNPRMSECHVSGKTPVPECTYGGDQLGVIVIGDSHASSIIRSVEKSLGGHDLHAMDWTLNSCPTIVGINSTEDQSYRCREFLDYLIKKSKNLKKTVPIIIVNRYSNYISGPNEPERHNELKKPTLYISSPYESRTKEFKQELHTGLIETACELSKAHPVYMLRPIPELKYDVPKTMGHALLMGNKSRRVSISLEEYFQRHAFIWETQDIAAERCGVKILDPLPYLCSEGYCWGDVDGLPIYYDDDHLNERGAALLIPLFRQMFEEA